MAPNALEHGYERPSHLVDHLKRNNKKQLSLFCEDLNRWPHEDTIIQENWKFVRLF